MGLLQKFLMTAHWGTYFVFFGSIVFCYAIVSLHKAEDELDLALKQKNDLLKDYNVVIKELANTKAELDSWQPKVMPEALPSNVIVGKFQNTIVKPSLKKVG